MFFLFIFFIYFFKKVFDLKLNPISFCFVLKFGLGCNQNNLVHNLITSASDHLSFVAGLSNVLANITGISAHKSDVEN